MAIVGRPNVGKSTLFNRLVESRKAIMDNQSGVTRDRHYGYATWAGQYFTVIDTGGYVHGTTDVFENAICKQVEIAVAEASVILFIVDCRNGLTGLDKDFAKVLRQSTQPILVTANKADNTEEIFAAHDFHQLGLGEVYPIAAISGAGTGELLDEAVKHFKNNTQEVSDDGIPRVAIVGRPNVGKSSLLNALVAEERNIVTPITGTTRDATDTHYKRYGKQLILTDTAGIRKKSKVQDNIEFYSVMRAIRALQDADVCLVMIDAENGLEAQDVNIIALAHRYKKGLLLLVNKWDLVQKDIHTAEAYRKNILEKIAPLDYIPIIFTSTIKKQRLYQTITQVMEVYQNRRQKLSTALLNKIMLEVIEKHAPPAVKGKYVKIKYITQLPVHTPHFAFFCNLPQYIKKPYERYLENQLRKNFNFQGVPIRLIFKKK